MSTSANRTTLEEAMQGVSEDFRDRLIDTYLEIKKSDAEAKHEAAGMAAGKFCEVALRFLQDEVIGNFTPFGKSIGNFANECRVLITHSPCSKQETIRVIIPRCLSFLYTLRNKRGIGHVGGDIDANAIDSATITRLSDWIICEFIRVYHHMPIEEAQDLIDAIAVRSIPDVWEVAGKRRVLKDGLRNDQKALLLLYSHPENAVLVEDLCEWIEYGRVSDFKRRLLPKLHEEKMIEFDRENDVVYLSPKGVLAVENEII